MYKLYNQPFPLTGQTILKIEDNAHIPMNPDNTDYQKYLKWVAEGNTPLPPDDTGATS